MKFTVSWMLGLLGTKVKSDTGSLLITSTRHVSSAVTPMLSVTTSLHVCTPLLVYVCDTFFPSASTIPSFSKSHSNLTIDEPSEAVDREPSNSTFSPE